MRRILIVFACSLALGQNRIDFGTQVKGSAKSIKYASDFKWKQAPQLPLSLTAGPNTITLSPCPQGFFVATNGATDYIPTQYVYVTGTGTSEADLATQVNGHGGDASCQFSITARNDHAQGYIVGSASGGIKECSEAARSSVGYIRTQGGTCVIDSNGTPFKVYAPLHFEASYQHIIGGGGLIQCWVSASIAWTQDDDCIVVGQRASQTKTVYVDIDGINIQPSNGNPVNYAFDAININAQGTRLHNVSVQYGGQSIGPFPVNPGSFNSYVSVCDDEAFLLDGISNFNGQALRNDRAGQLLLGLSQGDHTHGNVNGCFGVGWVKNLNASMQCTGNAINWKSGNGLRVSDSVVQGFAKFGILSGNPTGGFNPNTQVENVYFEVGQCSNPDYVAAGAIGTAARAQAAVIMQGGNVTLRGSTGPSGGIPVFLCSGSAGSTGFDYWANPIDPGASGSFPLYIGGTAATCSGTVTIYWPTATPFVGPLSWDILRTARVAGNAQPPFIGNCGGGTVNACGSVTTGQADNGSVNSFTDTVANNTSPYTITSLNLVPFLPFWPGNVVLSPAQATSRSALPAALVFTDNLSKLNGGTGLANGVLSTNGNLTPSAFGLAGTPNTLGSVNGGGLDSNSVMILRQTSPNGNAVLQNSKGQLHFWANNLTPNGGSGSIITLVDSNPAKTAASPGGLTSMDAADTWIGLDDATSHTVSQSQLAFGSPTSISFYLNTIPDNTNWKFRLSNGGLATIGGSANRAVCWKADGKTLGFCSTTPDSQGACTCN